MLLSSCNRLPAFRLLLQLLPLLAHAVPAAAAARAATTSALRVCSSMLTRLQGAAPASLAWAQEHRAMRWDAEWLETLAQQGPYAVAFLGDSITAGLQLAASGLRLGKCVEAAEKAVGGKIGIFGVPGAASLIHVNGASCPLAAGVCNIACS